MIKYDMIRDTTPTSTRRAAREHRKCWWVPVGGEGGRHIHLYRNQRFLPYKICRIMHSRYTFKPIQRFYTHRAAIIIY